MQNEAMVELFILETNQLMEQLEMIIMQCEKDAELSLDDINSIFRIMHTIKGSSAMMAFHNISNLSHSIEDLFFYIREKKDLSYDFSDIYKLVLEYIDYLKDEIIKIEKGNMPDGDCDFLLESSKIILTNLEKNSYTPIKKKTKANTITKHAKGAHINENCYCIRIEFEPNAEMENVRGHLLLYSLKEMIMQIIETIPQNLDLEESSNVIKQEGMFFCISSLASKEEIEQVISSAQFVKSYQVLMVNHPPKDIKRLFHTESISKSNQKKTETKRQQSYISVHSDKLDMLMDLVGELVISDAMVTNNPDLEGLQLENFNKSALLLRKQINELRDVVVDIRMLPISVVFQKMHRIIRDMSKKLGKDIEFVVSGEDTHVDKSVIDILSEPIMHLIRNAADHGIEDAITRKKANKPLTGRISLKAWQNNSYAFIQVCDDGRGINKKKIYQKAIEKEFTAKSFEELSDKELIAYVLAAGFSTNEKVTEYSGRGVGMDIVKKNIDLVGGSVSIDSEEGKGTTITLRIPLTLLIVNIMHIKIGNVKMAVPLRGIIEVVRANNENVVTDQDGNKMLIIRDVCYPVIHLSKLFRIDTDIIDLTKGILLLVEGDHAQFCLFADRIIGEQQVVVKPLPKYIKNTKGILGCSIQNDGSLSLILDINEIFNL